MRQVWDTIRQFHMLEVGDRVLLGVSGGPDSVALLHILHSKALEYGIQLHVVHINHMLRSEAVDEARYVEQLAKQYAIPFRLYEINVKEYAETNKMSLEQAGHVVRFQCFQDAKAVWKINKLALGHHKNDRAESVLLHMVQGCGTEGLTAMPPVDIWDNTDGSSLIRPLANIRKADIQQYCDEHALRYYIDATNLEPDCLRNQIRLELLPNMQQYNPQIVDALVRLQEICSAELDYIDQQTDALWEQYGSLHEHAAQFPAELFCTQHIALQRRLLRCLYQAWVGNTEDLSFAQVEQMRKIALQSNGTQMITLAHGKCFMRQYQQLLVTDIHEPSQEHREIHWNFKEQSVLPIWNGTLSANVNLSEPFVNSNDYSNIYVDLDKLDEELLIRTRKPGDRILLSGKGGHKTIKKFFIDRKVPKEVRDTVPIVFSDGEIIWIPGLYAAEHVRITEQTKYICKLSFSPA